MAVLPAQARQRVAAAFMREETGQAFGFSKAQLAAAVAAADDWAEANAAAFSNALPAAFRTAATAEQRAAVLAYVIWRRIGRLRVTEDG